ncbi:MAG: hypothetical protein AB8B55_14760 [Mariniblastus sp.]
MSKKNSTQRVRANQNQEEPKLPVGCWLLPLMFVSFLVASSIWQTRKPVYESLYVAQCEWIHHQNLRASIDRGDGFELKFDNLNGLNNAGSSLANPFEGDMTWVFGLDVDGETSNHFPAVPYLLFAGQFVTQTPEIFLSMLGTAFLAFGLTMLVNQVNQMFGIVAALISSGTMLADQFLLQAPILLTGDATMTGLLLVSVTIFLRAISPTAGEELRSGRYGSSRRSIWKWPIAGLLFGGAMLFRATTSLWLLVFLPALLIYLIVLRLKKDLPFLEFLDGQQNFPPTPKSVRRMGEPILLFAIGLLFAVSPWWICNCKVTKDFKPLGNEIQYKIIGSHNYGNTMDGNLNIRKVYSHRESLLLALVDEKAPIEKESFVAANHWNATVEWIEENPKLNRTMRIQRAWNHLGLNGLESRTRQAANLALVLGALIGCVISWRRFGFIVMILLVASTLVTALTWSDYGRLSLPIRPLLHASFAIGVASILAGKIFKRQPKRR